MEGPIRFVFPVALLLMWGLCAAGVSTGQWDDMLWLLLALAHVACAVVFRRFMWIFNYGYAGSMVLLHLAIAVAVPTAAGLAISAVGIAYGLRLWAFVHGRYRDPGYARIADRGAATDAKLPMPVRVVLWIAVSWLMTYGAMPAWQVAHAAELTPGVLAGIAVAVLGFLLEWVADHQKQAAKRADPNRLVTSGLYGRARHPNFAGEILFHAGLALALLAAADTWWARAAGLVTPAYIIILMIFQGIRGDRDQEARYGQDAAYQEWRRRTGRFLPGL